MLKQVGYNVLPCIQMKRIHVIHCIKCHILKGRMEELHTKKSLKICSVCQPDELPEDELSGGEISGTPLEQMKQFC